jgi:hypothetical protein
MNNCRVPARRADSGFLGLVVTGYRSVSDHASDAYHARYRRLGVFILISFVLSIACAAVVRVWLVELRKVVGLFHPVGAMPLRAARGIVMAQVSNGTGGKVPAIPA